MEIITLAVIIGVFSIRQALIYLGHYLYRGVIQEEDILSKGYRRARNFGFLHTNSKLISLVQLRKRVVFPSQQSRPTILCICCGRENEDYPHSHKKIHPPIMDSRVGQGDGHMTQHTPSICRTWQAWPRSPCKRVKTGKHALRMAG
ncbi:hypothetical protein W01_02000 [Candidatus Nitrotoga sp. AM1P]|nr:hypothetical protein W01_02000 [Candidatus Nitrotoga sp. AM1P]